ncbi:MAG: hypothetical protein AAB557_02510 [Patescibacteria group bacterium]
MKKLDADPALVRTDSYILLSDNLGSVISIDVTSDPVVVVEGCPVPNGDPSCVPFCSGAWPGPCTLTTAELTMLVNSGKINTARACGPVYERIVAAQQTIAALQENKGESGIL